MIMITIHCNIKAQNLAVSHLQIIHINIYSIYNYLVLELIWK